MGDLFLKTLNMSIAASWLILAVVLLRFVLKKAPKWVNVLLWGIVAIRLICPVTIESPASMIPDSVASGELISKWTNDYIGNVDIHHPNSVHYDAAIGAGREPISDGEGSYYVVTRHDQLDEPATIKNTVVPVLSVMWVAGMTVMAFYAVISFWHLRRKVNEAVMFKGNILLCDHVKSPFILGLIRPKIYLPSNMDATSMEPVIAHEKAHLTRRDHWWKPLGFLILTVHWFNPLCWVAYVLLCRDIELACDEKVIRQMDLDGKKKYSTSLLECSTGRRLVTICPLAFGEVDVKERVKNVLNYKKPAFWLMVVAVVACAVVTVCFATNPKQDSFQEQHTVQARITGVEDASFLVEPVEGASELSSCDLFRVPITNMPPSPEPQVGNIVEISYDGSILESYPAQFGTVYSMRVVSQENRPEIEELRVKYPEYFELGTFKGLEVYVWQMAENDYRFGLMQGTNREKTPEEKMALKGATAEEMALILSNFDIEDESIFVIPWQNPISSFMVTEDMVKDPEYINNIRTMLGLDGVSMGSAGVEDTPTTVGPDTAATTLFEEQTAIRQAILEQNKSSNPQEYDVACCSFTTLETLSGTPLAGSNTHKITYYGWALYEEYKVTDGGLETVSGSHIPVALSFDLDERGYILTEYWEPGDGSYYAQDIREKFPAHIIEDGMDSQKFILQQTQECYAQAVAAIGLDTDKVIGSLIETICSSPALSSNPGDYIEEHSIEYRELTYYGRYTLKYCFTEFLKGGQTDLRGHIMRAAIDDIAPEAQLNFDAKTGQEYFDAWKDAAISVGEQHNMEWIETHQPAIYLLLSMLGKV